MASEKGNAEVSDTHSSSIQANTSEQSSKSKQSEEPHFGKALAHRALYGASSSGRRSGGRKLRVNDVKAQPSRLSKVSLADNEENN